MFEGHGIIALALLYVAVLFVIAWVGDLSVRMRDRRRLGGRPLIYALSLGVYCTTWTFFGSVGIAASTGYDFLPVYLGPILFFTLGWPLILRIVRLSKTQNITSVADFIAARYGKSPAVAALVTGVAVVGVLPYIALQLKAVLATTSAVLGSRQIIPPEASPFGYIDAGLVIALALALFAVLFGTRHTDTTEHQDGLMLAISAESLVKLAAFIGVGIYVVGFAFGGPAAFIEKATSSAELREIFGRSLHGGNWLTVGFLSFVCIILLPRQFHVTVVENRDESEIRRAAWLFPAYLILINLFVIPIAAAGILLLPKGQVDADMYVLALPIANGASAITTLAYVGGLSAATAMVVVESIALAIMICNGVVVPLLLRQRILDAEPRAELAGTLLAIRRVAIFVVMLLGYAFYRALGDAQGLAAIGLISFAAIAQLAPAFFFGLFWRKGTARGAIVGIVSGFAVWSYTLLLPWVVKAGWLPTTLLTDGPLGLAILRPQALFFLSFEPLTHGVLWSMAANCGTYVIFSLLRAPEPIERLQAHTFVQDERPRAIGQPALRLWRTQITVGDLIGTAGRYLGAERAERSFQEFCQSRGMALNAKAEADIQTLRFTEHLLTSAIGAASARLVLSLLLRRSNIGSQAALKLLDDASEALQYNRDLLQSALDQVRHGLSVFDSDMRLICWNRRFRELLDLPSDLGRVGVPLDRIVRACAERGDFGAGDIDELVAERLMKLAIDRETFHIHVSGGERILEVRTASMPQGGIVTTYSDITERVAAANALASANLTLERRVRERTAELLEVNTALALAKARADEANLDKTRFIAAASHDILQPLNAARLYSTSLLDRALEPPNATIARNIDASLSAVEEIFAALIEISRIDAGRLEPEISAVALDEVLSGLAVEFEPSAREKGLSLVVVKSSLWVRSDRRLLRRLLQNFVGNAVKYTVSGTVLVGARRRAGEVEVAVIDTGPGIPAEQHGLIFREFQRLDQTANAARGVGLGLAIVERIGRVLDVEIKLRSKVGKGSAFSVVLPRIQAPERAAESRPPLPRLGSLKGLVVVCIDNEMAVLDGMQTLLGGWDCNTVVAASGESALAEIAARHVIPDVIIADYHLDHGTGREAILLLQSTLGLEIPAVVITADHTPETERLLRDDGIVVLRKPVKAAALRALLAQYQRRRQAAE